MPALDAFAHEGLGKTQLALQPGSGQFSEHGVDPIGSKTALFELGVQLAATVLAQREQPQRALAQPVAGLRAGFGRRVQASISSSAAAAAWVLDGSSLTRNAVSIAWASSGLSFRN